MSKYDSLWSRIQEMDQMSLKLSFSEVEEILHFPVDHSFLRYKKELERYGHRVKKISLKDQTILFEKIE